MGGHNIYTNTCLSDVINTSKVIQKPKKKKKKKKNK